MVVMATMMISGIKSRIKSEGKKGDDQQDNEMEKRIPKVMHNCILSFISTFGLLPLSLKNLENQVEKNASRLDFRASKL
jgi:hypothetical protein